MKRKRQYFSGGDMSILFDSVNMLGGPNGKQQMMTSAMQNMTSSPQVPTLSASTTDIGTEQSKVSTTQNFSEGVEDSKAMDSLQKGLQSGEIGTALAGMALSQVEKVDAGEGISYDRVGVAAGKGAISGAQKGAQMGKMFGPKGQAIGMAVGTLVGGVSGLVKGQKAKKEAIKTSNKLHNERIENFNTNSRQAYANQLKKGGVLSKLKYFFTPQYITKADIKTTQATEDAMDAISSQYSKNNKEFIRRVKNLEKEGQQANMPFSSEAVVDSIQKHTDFENPINIPKQDPSLDKSIGGYWANYNAYPYDSKTKSIKIPTYEKYLTTFIDKPISKLFGTPLYNRGLSQVHLGPEINYPADKTVAIHELTHQITQGNENLPDYAKELLSSTIDKKQWSERIRSSELSPEKKQELLNILDYVSSPTEIHARIQQIRHKLHPKNPYKKIKERDFNKLDEDLNYQDSLYDFLEFSDKKKLANVMNKMYTAAPIVGAGAIYSSLDEKPNKEEFSKGGKALKFIGDILGRKADNLLESIPAIQQKRLKEGTEAYKRQINSPEFERRAKNVGYSEDQIATMRKWTNETTPKFNEELNKTSYGSFYPGVFKKPDDEVHALYDEYNLLKELEKVKELNTPVLIRGSRVDDVKNTVIHEMDHNRLNGSELVPELLRREIDNITDATLSTKKRQQYLRTPEEIGAVMQQIRHIVNPKNPYKRLSSKDLNLNYYAFPKNVRDTLDIITDNQKFVRLLNTLPAAGGTVVGVSYLSPEKKDLFNS